MQENNSIEKISKVFLQIKDKVDFEASLADILTPAEIHDIAERIRILEMLKAGISQRKIALELGISITTVTRGSRIFKYDGKAITKYL
ncbi:helix-turn-helix domain-containing protein [Candidatus Gracilibacteria bacterium]|nr:helix-turn-helix domain-containing protein [Candidatus Gracilibacteria bacterium]NUJ99000.1 helix-turn-helix domain-containing protein [Candidatus Gracilibacteria bacterium]